ncbi:MAG: ankyrin repeat domain-containing protein [Chlamydiales bacterium]|nr:ankyrin repeat domain-containing protein [Chlamydiales bacterium]
MKIKLIIALLFTSISLSAVTHSSEQFEEFERTVEHWLGKKITHNDNLDHANECDLLTQIQVRYGNNPEGIGSLHYAILQKDILAVDLLLYYGASPYTVDYQGNTCLDYALQADCPELIKKFLALGIRTSSQVVYNE